MPFKLADWRRLAARLKLARLQVAQFRREAADGESKPQYLLDSAVVAIHASAEYAVNALLELAGQKPERHHKMGDRARDLRADGRLQGDYKKPLDQLESYRLAAQYLGYGRTPSVHYNATNVEECLSAVDKLVVEVEAALRSAGKLQ
jgi:HEPN domain-containing protein